MGTIRVPEEIWAKTRKHLLDTPGEHFAFWEAAWDMSNNVPIFLVKDAHFIPDSHYQNVTLDGVEIRLDGVIDAINSAIKNNHCLIEMHNHGGKKPRFSHTDRTELASFIPYVLDSLPNRPYAVIVWGDDTVYGEYFLTDGTNGQMQSITTVGSHLYQMISKDDDLTSVAPRFDRQLAWFGKTGQKQISRLKIGIVGCGGTGSQVIRSLGFLGCKNYVLIDDDVVDETNLNRLVTATPADIGTPKTILGRRFIRTLDSQAQVHTICEKLESHEALDALKGVDVLFGCVDNDGARLILNEFAKAYNIPLIDIAVGIYVEDGTLASIGGRVVIVTSDGPCLYCMGEIDIDEASYFLSSPTNREEQRARGYITGMDVKAPSVESLNAFVSAAAILEFQVLISGIRPVNVYSEYDLLGNGRSTKGQWMTPREVVQQNSCVYCINSGIGANTNIERYSDLSTKTDPKA